MKSRCRREHQCHAVQPATVLGDDRAAQCGDGEQVLLPREGDRGQEHPTHRRPRRLWGRQAHDKGHPHDRLNGRRPSMSSVSTISYGSWIKLFGISLSIVYL